MDVAAWLRDLGLERYVSAFRDNDIGTEVLPKLTAEDLISIGVTSVGHRRKLLDAIATLSASEAARRAVRPKDCKARRPTRSTFTGRNASASPDAPELKFQIQLPPADSPSLSGFRLCPGKDAGFPPFLRPCGAAASAETRNARQHALRRGSVSVGRYPVPQCCRRRFARLAASAANEIGLAISVRLGVRIGSNQAEQDPLILPGQWQT